MLARPDVCDRLEPVVQVVRPDAQVWRGSMLPTDRQGQSVRDPIGTSPQCCLASSGIVQEHHTLFDRIPHVKDLQCAWLLLLHCASACANCQFRTVDPANTGEFSEAHDQSIWQCLCNILHRPQTVRDIASLSCVGRSWPAQCKTDSSASPLRADCTDDSRKTPPFFPPSWRAHADGERPDMHNRRNSSLACHEEVGKSRVEQHSETLICFHGYPRAITAGPGAGLALLTCPTCRITTGGPKSSGPPPLFAPPSSSVVALLAGVANHSTLVATTGQLARGLGSWGGTGLTGERCCSHLLRGWCQGDHKHSRP